MARNDFEQNSCVFLKVKLIIGLKSQVGKNTETQCFILHCLYRFIRVEFVNEKPHHRIEEAAIYNDLSITGV